MTSAVSDRARLLELIGGSWKTQAIHAMVELRLADRLAEGPMQTGALAQALQAHEGALHRLLRGLRILGLVERCDEGHRLTTMGELLRTEPHRESLAQWVRWWAGVQWPTWGMLAEAVRENVPVRARSNGAGGYGLHAKDEDAAETFHAAMAQLSAGVSAPLVRRIAALAPRCIVDVGGGRAELLAELLVACPTANGILLEQSHALASAREHLERSGLQARSTLVAGDFFQHVPEGADLYVLKSVLHNWDEGSATRLLRTCRRAMPGHSLLAVIERVIDDNAPAESDVRSDLNMLVSLGGRERSAGEFDLLLRSAGLAPREQVRCGEHSLIMCEPA